MSSVLRIPGANRLRYPLAGAGARTSTASAPPESLRRLFAESVWGLAPWMIQARLADFSHGGAGVALGTATGTPADRQGGRDLPLFWSEIDLRGYRILARHITDSNPFGKGFMKLLKNYHIRKGFGWQACKKGAKKTPYQTAGAPEDPLVAKGQRILDAFRDAAKWPLRSRESFHRWCRDGEVYGRWFFGGSGRLPEFRFGEPDAVGSPTGNNDDDESFGHANVPGDIETITDYHFFEPDMTRGEWIGASRVTYAKRNVDSGVKRGLPDFFPVAQELEDCTTLIRTMLATSIRQAKTAWIEKFPTATVAQVSAAVPQYAPATGYSGQATPPYEAQVPWWLLPQFGGGLNPWEPPGAVRKVEGNREYEAGPTSTGIPGYVQVEQAALRGCGVIWSFPEYFSGDASNNNMASAIVAGSPFTVEVESSQFEFGAVWERPCALKVLELARDAGLLSYEEWSQLDVEVTEPAVVTPQPDKDTATFTQQLQAKIVSLDTVRQKLGYDPQHEAEGVKKDMQTAMPEAVPAPGPTAPPPGAGDDMSLLESTDASGHQHKGKGPGGGQFTGKGGGSDAARALQASLPPRPSGAISPLHHAHIALAIAAEAMTVSPEEIAKARSLQAAIDLHARVNEDQATALVYSRKPAASATGGASEPHIAAALAHAAAARPHTAAAVATHLDALAKDLPEGTARDLSPQELARALVIDTRRASPELRASLEKLAGKLDRANTDGLEGAVIVAPQKGSEATKLLRRLSDGGAVLETPSVREAAGQLWDASRAPLQVRVGKESNSDAARYKRLSATTYLRYDPTASYESHAIVPAEKVPPLSRPVESRVLAEHGFTGTDKRGVKWVDGKEVKSTDTDKPGADAHTSPSAQEKAATDQLAAELPEEHKGTLAKLKDAIEAKLNQTAGGRIALALGHGAHWVAHQLEKRALYVMKKTQELAIAAAKERGLSETAAGRLAKALYAADFMGGYATGAAATALGLPIAAIKASMFLPSASVVYLVYSTARNPLATLRAARAVVASTFAAKAKTESAGTMSFEDLAGMLAERMSRSDVDGEWYFALFVAALGHTQGDAEKAIELADAAVEAQPTGPAE